MKYMCLLICLFFAAPSVFGGMSVQERIKELKEERRAEEEKRIKNEYEKEMEKYYRSRVFMITREKIRALKKIRDSYAGEDIDLALVKFELKNEMKIAGYGNKTGMINTSYGVNVKELKLSQIKRRYDNHLAQYYKEKYLLPQKTRLIMLKDMKYTYGDSGIDGTALDWEIGRVKEETLQ